MKKSQFLKTVFIIPVLMLISLYCGRKPTGPEKNEPNFPVSDGTWWQYRQIQRTVYLNRHETLIVYDTIVWSIDTKKGQGKSLIIKTINDGNVTLDTVGLIVKGDAIYAIGYRDLAGSTPLFKAVGGSDTTLLVPEARATEWTRGTVKYSVIKDTTVIWHGKPYKCRLISEEHNNKPISMVTLGTIGFIRKEYTPDTLISFADTAITSATLELDTFQIK